jgi:hypothetical protein
MILLGQTKPDRIELEQGLLRWAGESWFLDDAEINQAEVGPDGQRLLPRSWRLGSRPNLRQMHDDACARVPDELVETKLLGEIAVLKSLKEGANAAGASVHVLPQSPNDVEDDGRFRYVVLGPKAASDAGKPSAEAVRFLTEHAGPKDLRVCKNSVVLMAPSFDGLEAARSAIRDYLGWEEVRAQLKDQPLDPIREQMLIANLDASRKGIPGAIRQCYSMVVTVSAKGEAEAFKVTVENEPLFNLVKRDERSRIQDTAVEAEALLPEAPYSLWGEGETSRRVKDLVEAFARYPHLPKMLKPSAILDTLVSGCVQGSFVMQVTRPDRSVRTFWREAPDEMALKDETLEAVLPEAAVLSDLTPAALTPGLLPGLWEGDQITVGQLLAYFSGGRVVKVRRDGYEEPVTIPGAKREAVDAAVRAAVRGGKLWLTSGPASILSEEIPAGLLTGDVVLQAAPAAVSAVDVMPECLPDAWAEGSATALAISVALSKKAGKTLPWATVREGIDGAVKARMLELPVDSGPWPCGYSGAQLVKLRPPTVEVLPPGQPARLLAKPGVRVAEAGLSTSEIQDLAEVVGDLRAAAVGHELKFHLRVELGGATAPPEDVAQKVSDILKQVSPGLDLH